MEQFVNDAPTIIGYVGRVPIYLFGLMTAIGLFVGTAVALLQAERFGLSLSKLFEFSPWAIIAGVVGARLVYVFIHWADYRGALFSIVRLGEGGFSFYGGVAGGIVALWLYTRFVPLELPRALDALAPGLAIGQAVGFVGVQIVGRTTSMPWGVIIQQSTVHPLPAYGILLAYGLFFVLWRMGGERVPPGSLFLNYLLLHGLGSIVLGIWSTARTYAGMSAGQWIGLVVFVIALTLVFVRRDQRPSHRNFGSALYDMTVMTRSRSVGSTVTQVGLWLTGLLVLLGGFVARLS